MVAHTLAAQYPRYGYRRIQIFLKREGHLMSADRTHCLWRQAGLQVPRRRPVRWVATGQPRPLPPTAQNHVWAYDFVFDTCDNRQTLKCLTVVDEWTRECLAIDVAGGIRSGPDLPPVIGPLLVREFSVWAPQLLRAGSLSRRPVNETLWVWIQE